MLVAGAGNCCKRASDARGELTSRPSRSRLFLILFGRLTAFNDRIAFTFRGKGVKEPWQGVYPRPAAVGLDSQWVGECSLPLPTTSCTAYPARCDVFNRSSDNVVVRILLVGLLRPNLAVVRIPRLPFCLCLPLTCIRTQIASSDFTDITVVGDDVVPKSIVSSTRKKRHASSVYAEICDSGFSGTQRWTTIYPNSGYTHSRP
ncbi:hypothetical protein C8Q78DRAFT_501688 [Trametes maxima]|nr:hypothetical protein C8Q78DRAFT_501688 [Trametes maxima]